VSVSEGSTVVLALEGAAPAAAGARDLTGGAGGSVGASLEGAAAALN
jgi:hypothetical protein